jgi:hypothetical protein
VAAEDPPQVQQSLAYQAIARAIDERLAVSATYQAETEPRILWPSRIGVRNGSHFVEAFQIGGYSFSGLPADGQ